MSEFDLNRLNNIGPDDDDYDDDDDVDYDDDED